MRFPFSIAVPAVRSWLAELKFGIHAGHFCLFCDLPMICAATLAYLGKSCLYHKYDRKQRASFLDGSDPSEGCNCPYCRNSRSRATAA